MAIKQTILKNGIHVLTDEHKGAKMVSVCMHVHSGSKDEPKHQVGISHFVEHMMFRGTKDMNGTAMRKAFADLGIHHNGGTGADFVDYYMSLLATDLDTGMSLFAKMLTEPAFDPKEFEIEKGVVANEIKRAPDDNERKFTHFLFESVYPNTPISRDGLGTEKIIKNFKPNDLRNYWKKIYTTNKITFAARGGVSHLKFVKLCEKLFNSFPVSKDKQKQDNYAGVSGLKKKIESSQSQVWVAVSFPYNEHILKNFYARNLALTILGASDSSRLYTKIREERGLAYAVQARSFMSLLYGQHVIRVKNKAENTEEVLKLICEECRKFASDVTEDELAQAKKQVLVGLASNEDSLSGGARYMAINLKTFGCVVQSEDKIKGYESVTLEDIKRVAKKMFSSAPTVVVMGPKCKTPTYKTICKWLKGE